MSCEFCAGKFIPKKLGRCQQCIWLNFLLLIFGWGVYAYVDVVQLKAVQQVALIMFIGATSILMGLHMIFWCFYRFKSRKTP